MSDAGGAKNSARNTGPELRTANSDSIIANPLGWAFWNLHWAKSAAYCIFAGM